MKIFLSWSGEKSKKIAESLKDWLEQVIQTSEPWVSTSIEKGKRWSKEISDKLEESKVGIICLTKENLNAPWILFEAGAISKSSDSYVCTFLTDISSSTEISGPLSSFQNTRFAKEEVLKLLKTINNRIKDSKGGKALNEKALEEVFETFYPKLELKINTILEERTEELILTSHIRSDRELLEEVVENQRLLKEKINDIWTNKEVHDIVEYYVSHFIQNKNGITHDFQIIEEPHFTEFRNKLADNPLIKKLFSNTEDFKALLIKKYELPF
jgi:TIR domain